MAKHGMKLAQELIDLKSKIEREKVRRAELKGELKSTKARLKEDFGVDSLKAGEDLLAKMAEDRKILTAQREDGIIEVKEMMGIE